MEGKAVLELADVVVASAPIVSRVVECNAEIETEDKEVKVIAQTYAGAEGNVVGKMLQFERTPGTMLIFVHEPHVAGINKKGTAETAENGEAKLDVGFELDVAGLVHIRVARTRGVETPGSDGADGEGTDAVGSAHVELVAVGGETRVAVGPHNAAHEAGGETILFTDFKIVVQFSGQFQILSEWIVEKFLVLLSPLLTGQGIDA